MAAIATAPSAPTETAIPREELASKFMEFAAAGPSINTQREANSVLQSITDQQDGVEWLQQALAAQHDDNIPGRLMTQGIAERFTDSCPAAVRIVTTMSNCSIMLVTNSPVRRTGRIQFTGVLTPDVAASDGKFEYNESANNLGSVEYAVVNAGQISVQIYLYRAGELIGRYTGSSISNQIPPNRGPIEGW